jgi:prevent-host-death family protein
MSSVSVREFSYNPSAMFARVEHGEAIEVTRHGKVIAVLLPGASGLGLFAPRGQGLDPAQGDHDGRSRPTPDVRRPCRRVTA